MYVCASTRPANVRLTPHEQLQCIYNICLTKLWGAPAPYEVNTFHLANQGDVEVKHAVLGLLGAKKEKPWWTGLM